MKKVKIVILFSLCLEIILFMLVLQKGHSRENVSNTVTTSQEIKQVPIEK